MTIFPVSLSSFWSLLYFHLVVVFLLCLQSQRTFASSPSLHFGLLLASADSANSPPLSDITPPPSSPDLSKEASLSAAAVDIPVSPQINYDISDSPQLYSYNPSTTDSARIDLDQDPSTGSSFSVNRREGPVLSAFVSLKFTVEEGKLHSRGGGSGGKEGVGETSEDVVVDEKIIAEKKPSVRSMSFWSKVTTVLMWLVEPVCRSHIVRGRSSGEPENDHGGFRRHLQAAIHRDGIDKASKFQITLWLVLVLVFVLALTIYATLDITSIRDRLLYTKMQSTTVRAR